jgi:hypothetical protein
LKPQVSWIDYRNFFQSATTSAFKFDPVIINPDEKLLSYGGLIEYNSGPLIISTDYKRFDYHIHDSANYYGGGLTYIKLKSPSSKKIASIGGSIYRMDGKTDALIYTEYRFFASLNIDQVELAADFLDVKYDIERNGIKNTYSISGYIGYIFSKSLSVSGDIEYGKNPEFDREIKTLFKLVYKL